MYIDVNKSSLTELAKFAKDNPEVLNRPYYVYLLNKAVLKHKGCNSIKLSVAGISFYQSVANKLKDFEEVSIEREYNNPYDANAIKILYNEELLGYIPRQYAADLKNLSLKGFISQIKQGEIIGCTLEVFYK